MIMETIIARQYLKGNIDHVFVFGDNLKRIGSALRNEVNTYGFITKKEPAYYDSAYYKREQYIHVYKAELKKLIKEIELNSDRHILYQSLVTD